MSFGVGENFGIGLKVPLTLYGKEDVAEFDAALVAIDTLRRFVKRWEFDPDAKHKVAQRIATVWPAVTEQVARAAGIPLGEDASQTILCDLLNQAELLAVALSYWVCVSNPEKGGAKAHRPAFAALVTDKTSEAYCAWEVTAQLFGSLNPSVLESDGRQHVSATKTYFNRLVFPPRLTPVVIDVPVPMPDVEDDPTPTPPDDPPPVVVVVAPVDPTPEPEIPSIPEPPTPTPTPAPAPKPPPGPKHPGMRPPLFPPPSPTPPSPPPEDELVQLVDPVDPGPAPPMLLMDAFNQTDFVAIMGAKQGPLVRFGYRTDAKVDMLTQLKAFNDGTTDAARRAALGTLVAHCGRYITDNVGNATRKAGRLDYVRALQEAARWESEQGRSLSSRLDTTAWTLTPKRCSNASGVLSGLLALDANAGMIEDLMGHADEPAKAKESAENLGSAATKLSSGAGKLKLGTFNGFLGSIADSLNPENFSEAVGVYLDLLDFMDISGVGKLATAYQAFSDYKRTVKRIAAVDRRKDSTDWFVREFVGYANGKLFRRKVSTIFVGVTNFIGGLSRILTLVTGATAAVVTEAINLSMSIAGAIYNVFRDLKGTYKFLLGTRGVARKTRASLLIWRASLDAQRRGAPDLSVLAGTLRAQSIPGNLSDAAGVLRAVTDCLKGEPTARALRSCFAPGEPTEAMSLFKDFLEPDFVTGIGPIKMLKQMVWDRLWSSGHEGVRVVIALAIDSVKSDESMTDVLKRAAASHGEERVRILLAMRVSLTLQKLMFEGLSSRAKLGASSWLGNRQDAFLQDMLAVA